MKKSTTATIAIIALLLGSGASGLLYAMPAHQEQDKLKGQKSSLTREHKKLTAKVEAEEAKLNGMAMDTISYFDLRKAPNKRRDLESKTVETLASLTEIFNDNKIKVVDLTPGPEVSGVTKPVPQVELTPEEAKKAEEAKQAAAVKAKAEKKKKKKKKKKGDPEEATEAKGPEIDLVHKQFKFTIRGEYDNLVSALSEIQGLPKAISVSQYDLKLINATGLTDGGKKAKKNTAVVEAVSPTALEMSFQMSVSFLMSGGPDTSKKKKPAEEPEAKKKAAAAPTGWLLADYWLGLPAEAAEEKAEKPVSKAPRFHFKGVKYENGVLRVETGRGTPHFEATGLGARKFVVTLKETTMAESRVDYEIGQGGIVSAHAEKDPKHPGVIRLVIETDGKHRFQTKTDARFRLTVVPSGKIPHESPASQPAAAKAVAKPAPAKPVAAKPAKRQKLQAVTIDGGSVLVKTSSGKAPAYEVLGRHKTSLVLELDNVSVTAPGKEFPLAHPGVVRARAALYGNRPVTTRLMIDTDGTVDLKPVTDAEGHLRILIEPKAGVVAKAPAKPAAKPVAAKPAAKAPAKAPVKVAKAPAPKPKKKSLAAKPEPSPMPMPSLAPESYEESPRLTRSLSSSYSFPIDRERTTGRANPFKVIPGKRELAAAQKAAGVPNVGNPAVVPPPPAMTPGSMVNSMLGVKESGSSAAAPASVARSTTYVLQAVVIWGNQPPLAVIQVDGKTHQVGLNGILPGNARVKSIKDDYVVLDDGGRTLRLSLKK